MARRITCDGCGHEQREDAVYSLQLYLPDISMVGDPSPGPFDLCRSCARKLPDAIVGLGGKTA